MVIDIRQTRGKMVISFNYEIESYDKEQFFMHGIGEAVSHYLATVDGLIPMKPKEIEITILDYDTKHHSNSK